MFHKFFAFIALFLLLTACNERANQSTEKQETSVQTQTVRVFPEAIDSLFEHHGGYQLWAQQRYLQFTLPKPKLPEVHQIDLKSRKDKIITDKFSLGFDGKQVWIQQDSSYFGGNPRFYHNLMFYFYAMPFVLGDPGIVYEPAEDLVYQDTLYKGYKISFKENVGETPEDNYFLYLHPQTGRMAWLGYTVTFFTGETSNKVSYINYTGWKETNGLLLPTRLEWHEYKDGKLGGVTNTVTFTDPVVQTHLPENVSFAMPDTAMVVEK